MSKRFFRAMRDFAFVHLLPYLRAFAIFLIFASPVLATLYFFPTLDHFNKVKYHVPSFALLALSALIFYRLRMYFTPDYGGPWAELELPPHERILLGIAIVLAFIGVILSPPL